MALAETIFVDKCEVVSIASTYCAGHQKVITIQVRKADVIEKDGVEIASNFERYVLEAGTLDASDNLVDTDISSEPSEVQAVCNGVWTDSVKAALKAQLIAEKT